jgi:hypothetical protein
MQMVIELSDELREDYDGIAEIYLTDKGIYGCGEDDFIAERLLNAKRARLAGTRGYLIGEFQDNMRRAIKKGAAHGR